MNDYFNPKTKKIARHRRKRPGACPEKPEGNPDLEFIQRDAYVYGKRAYGRCDALLEPASPISPEVRCQYYALKPGGRCGYHGGLSTGPRTEAGLRKSMENLERSWKAQRERKAQRAKKADA